MSKKKDQFYQNKDFDYFIPREKYSDFIDGNYVEKIDKENFYNSFKK